MAREQKPMNVSLKTFLRLADDELNDYLRFQFNPLGFLNVVNLAPNRDWHFSVGYSKLGVPTLNIQPPAPLNWELLLAGIYPDVLNGSGYVWKTEAESVVVTRDALDASTDFDLSTLPEGLSVMHYGGKVLLPDFHRHNQLEQHLRRETWVGSLFDATVPSRIEYRFMLDTHTFINHSPRLPGTVADIQLESRKIRLLADVKRGFRIRHELFGTIPTMPALEPIIGAIASRGIRGGTVEFSKEWGIERGVLGSARFTEDIATLVRDLVPKIRTNAELDRLAQKSIARMNEQAAKDLNRRIQAAQNAPRVFHLGRLLGNVPESEAGAVAIFHKLEALEALPVARLSTRAWAGASGIDALADLQLGAADHINLLAPIEFEFVLANFHNHKHPHEQVKLVVCWGAQDHEVDWQSECYGMVKQSKLRIPVLVLSRIPDLTIEGAKS